MKEQLISDPILVSKLENRVDHDGDVAAQRGDAQRRARMPAGLAQRLHHKQKAHKRGQVLKLEFSSF